MAMAVSCSFWCPKKNKDPQRQHYTLQMAPMPCYVDVRLLEFTYAEKKNAVLVF